MGFRFKVSEVGIVVDVAFVVVLFVITVDDEVVVIAVEFAVFAVEVAVGVEV